MGDKVSSSIFWEYYFKSIFHLLFLESWTVERSSPYNWLYGSNYRCRKEYAEERAVLTRNFAQRGKQRPSCNFRKHWVQRKGSAQQDLFVMILLLWAKLHFSHRLWEETGSVSPDTAWGTCTSGCMQTNMATLGFHLVWRWGTQKFLHNFRRDEATGESVWVESQREPLRRGEKLCCGRLWHRPVLLWGEKWKSQPVFKLSVPTITESRGFVCVLGRATTSCPQMHLRFIHLSTSLRFQRWMPASHAVARWQEASLWKPEEVEAGAGSHSCTFDACAPNIGSYLRSCLLYLSQMASGKNKENHKN